MKTVFLGLWMQFRDHPLFLSFMAFIGSILNFALESSQTVGVMFVGLFAIIGINVWQGVTRAKKEGKYDKKILKEKTINKVVAYCTLLVTVAIATLVMYVFSFKGTQSFIDNYYLRMPLMICELFFVGVEFLSIKDNVQIIFGIKTPNSVVDNIEKFVGGKQDINDLIKGDDK